MSNIIEIRPVGAEFYVEGRNGTTDGQTDMTKIIVAFRNSANTSKKSTAVSSSADTLFATILSLTSNTTD